MPFLLEDALEQQGAVYKKNLVPFTERVEVDGQLITGQNPQSARGVGDKLVERLRSESGPARSAGTRLRYPVCSRPRLRRGATSQAERRAALAPRPRRRMILA